MTNMLGYWQTYSNSFPCNDGHLSQPLFYNFYADLYCYANVRVTYPTAVLLTGTCWSQQSVEVLISVQWFANVIVLLPQQCLTALF